MNNRTFRVLLVVAVMLAFIVLLQLKGDDCKCEKYLKYEKVEFFPDDTFETQTDSICIVSTNGKTSEVKRLISDNK